MASEDQSTDFPRSHKFLSYFMDIFPKEFVATPAFSRKLKQTFKQFEAFLQRQKKERSTHPLFLPYLEDYEKLKGRPLDYPIKIFFIEDKPDSVPNSAVAQCNFITRNIYIFLSPEEWMESDFYDEDSKRYYIFHELGHCDLNRIHSIFLYPHRWNQLPHSHMQYFTFKDLLGSKINLIIEGRENIFLRAGKFLLGLEQSSTTTIKVIESYTLPPSLYAPLIGPLDRELFEENEDTYARHHKWRFCFLEREVRSFKRGRAYGHLYILSVLYTFLDEGFGIYLGEEDLSLFLERVELLREQERDYFQGRNLAKYWREFCRN